MRTLRRWLQRISVALTDKRDEDRLRQEVDEHIALLTDEFVRSGMPAVEARRQAMMKFGAVEALKEEYREKAGMLWIDNLRRDTRFALRQLRKAPGFASMAIAILAIGIGASTAIFAFVDAALIRPLPYPEPSRLVYVTETIALFPRANLSYKDYLDWRAMNHVFTSLEIYTGHGEILTTPTGKEIVNGESVSAGFFRTLGVAPILGRDFHDGEDTPNAPNTVILSYAAWQKRFAGKSDIIGQSVTLSDGPYAIVGVLPKDFDFAPRGGTEFWTPFHASADPKSCAQRRSCHNLNGIARLKEGVTVAAALSEMTLIAQQLEKQFPDSNRGQGALVIPLSELIVGDIRPVLLMLLSGALLLLVIACVNVASLLLVRSERRKRELNIRGALGASPARLLMQFVTEAVVLVGAGSALGVLFASQAIHILLGLISDDMLSGMPFLQGLSLNPHVAGFALVISIIAAALFAITPLLRLPWRNFRDGLAEGERGSAGRWRSFGGKMVVLELATAMVLLVGAGLLGKSFYRLLHVGIGFDAEQLAMVRISAPQERYKDEAAQVSLARQVVSTISALPGVKSVALASTPPVSFNGNTDWVRIVGRPYNGVHNEVNERDVSAEFFSTLRVRLLRGRFFTDAEDASKPQVMIINQAFARKYFPGEDPIGQHIGDTDLSPKSIREIVGVVDDVREGALDSEIVPAEYHPLNQDPSRNYSVIARADQANSALAAEMSRAIRQMDPSVVAFGETTMEQRIHDSNTARLHRSAAWLVAGFAALALLLGVAGLYAVIAYSVNQRTREIGVRMALGAQRASVYRMILTEAGWLTGMGLVTGIVASMGAVTLMKKMLFGVSRWDFPTLIAVTLLLGAAALLASFVPARRAASVSPVEALRTE
jgi:predicted permease